jgi:hypothetical protein
VNADTEVGNAQLGSRAVTEREHTFTVALVGPVYGYPDEPVFDGPLLEDQRPELPYAERMKLEVSATSETTLGEIIDSAAARLGTSSHFHDRVADGLTGIAFYEPRDEMGLGAEPELRWQETIRIVDESGNPSWAVRWVDLRVDELLASHEAGLVAGDPSRPYLWPLIPQGGMLQQLSDALWTLWLHWEHVLAAYGSFDLASRMLRRIKKGQAGLTAQEGVPWWRRLARPHDFFAYLAASPRSSEEVAALVGCSISEAEGVLWGMGFVAGEDRLWRPALDAPSRVLHESVERIEVLGRVETEGELERRISVEAERTEPSELS